MEVALGLTLKWNGINIGIKVDIEMTCKLIRKVTLQIDMEIDMEINMELNDPAVTLTLVTILALMIFADTAMISMTHFKATSVVVISN